MKYSEDFATSIKTTLRLIILYQSPAGGNASYRSCNQMRLCISALFKVPLSIYIAHDVVHLQQICSSELSYLFQCNFYSHTLQWCGKWTLGKPLHCFGHPNMRSTKSSANNKILNDKKLGQICLRKLVVLGSFKELTKRRCFLFKIKWISSWLINSLECKESTNI